MASDQRDSVGHDMNDTTDFAIGLVLMFVLCSVLGATGLWLTVRARRHIKLVRTYWRESEITREQAIAEIAARRPATVFHIVTKRRRNG